MEIIHGYPTQKSFENFWNLIFYYSSLNDLLKFISMFLPLHLHHYLYSIFYMRLFAIFVIIICFMFFIFYFSAYYLISIRFTSAFISILYLIFVLYQEVALLKFFFPYPDFISHFNLSLNCSHYYFLWTYYFLIAFLDFSHHPCL